jgi:hypothetical protein
VHGRFDELVRAENNAEFFGATGYLGGAIVNKNGSAWPDGTTAPDAVFGRSPLQPGALVWSTNLLTRPRPVALLEPRGRNRVEDT